MKLDIPFRVLYLFSGVERRADIAEFLEKKVAEANTALLHYTVQLKMENIDTKRGGADHNLLIKDRQHAFLDRIKTGELDAVFVTPNCNKFS